jgi:hypothetical protein
VPRPWRNYDRWMIRGVRALYRVVVSLCLCGALAAAAGADTIVLKNGRRITVDVATESGDRVTGETAAGQISLPKSMVERIEHTPLDYSAQTSNANNSAKTIAIAAPAEAADIVVDPAIARAAVHDGAIDRAFIAQTEQSAMMGEAGGAERAAAAHHAAAEFLTAKGDSDAAVKQDADALRFLPNNLALLLHVSYVHLQRSEYSKALEYLTRAKRVAPDSPDVAKLSGWASYGLNKIPEAVTEWKRALQLRQDPDVATALARAERDARMERDFRDGQTSHFSMKYSGAVPPALAAGILRALEIDFDQISALLNYTPAEPVGVILYPNEQFEDITRAPAWVGAINDGRIRVPVQGLDSVTDELARVLRHELTHSFLQQKTLGRCPTWLQEGIAEWMEGRRIGTVAAALIAAYDNHSAIPLSDLEVSWLKLSGTGASFAYAWSLAVVETILARDGISDLERLLDELKGSASPEQALRSTLHIDYAELDRQTAEYLRGKSGQ